MKCKEEKAGQIGVYENEDKSDSVFTRTIKVIIASRGDSFHKQERYEPDIAWMFGQRYIVKVGNVRCMSLCTA